jgi:peptide/nickel transport system ATP-binding protein
MILEGDVPSPVNPPSGCHFHPRCQYAVDICKTDAPLYRDLGDEHFVACHRADELNLQPIRGA